MTMTTPQPQASAQVFGDLLMPTSLPPLTLSLAPLSSIPM